MAKVKTQRPVRFRKRSTAIDHDKLGGYLHECLRVDLDNRHEWNDQRIQRYAKLRGWVEPKTFPWANASNAHLPFLMRECLRTQDTLYNAALNKRPMVEARAVHAVNREKQAGIDQLLDYQFFVEQQGEDLISQLAQQFTEQGNLFAYVPWVRYEDSVNDIRIFDPLPETLSVAEGVMNGIQQVLPPLLSAEPRDADGFQWTVSYQEGDTIKEARVEAFIPYEGARLELSIKRRVECYNGPVVMPKSVDEWVVPWNCENVQPPSPANPNGADHVILLDYPTVDEVNRLYASGYYDALTEQAHTELQDAGVTDPMGEDPNASLSELKDEFEGIHGDQTTEAPEEVTANRKLTRMTCFLGWDVNGDGLEEQIVVWMIKETKTILRVRYLTEDYPSDPPLRPLAEESFLPVEGRLYAISQLELLESLHDLMKTTFDQMVDNATIKNVPWFAYKPTAGMNPETFHIAPGEGIPLNNPQNDLFMPTFPQQGEAFGFNLMAMLDQLSEKLSMQGDLQFGRVPQGKASALRTAAGMQSVLSQGQARPERILRRFFGGLSQIFAIMHELNQRFLPQGKEFRLINPDANGQPVYATLNDMTKISGKMQFEFRAGIFNSHKDLAVQVLQTLMGMLVNPLILQLGIVQAPQVHNLMTDFIKLLQHEPTRYLVPPPPQQQKMLVTAQEAMSLVLLGRMPRNTAPREGYQAHLQAFAKMMGDPEFQLQEPMIQTIAQVYVTNLQQEMAQQQQQQQMLQAAQQFQQSMGGGGTPGPVGTQSVNTGISGNPPINQNELLNESLPGAR